MANMNNSTGHLRSLLVIRPHGFTTGKSVRGIRADIGSQQGDQILRHARNEQILARYPLVLGSHPSAGSLVLCIRVDTRQIDSYVARTMGKQMKHILSQLCAASSQQKLADIELISKHDTTELWRRNRSVPPSFDFCIHHLVAATTQENPSAQAVCAWDGTLTYAQLDELSTNLAHTLVKEGVKPKDTVPLCFEKSMWTVVAMLGVMKAGGMSLALDTQLPGDRLRSVIGTTKPSLIVASVLCQQLATRLLCSPDNQIILISASHVADMRPSTRSNLPLVQPSSPL
ncbi:hypothetical protein LTS12_027377, partial [Elasticomyces elasticus]